VISLKIYVSQGDKEQLHIDRYSFVKNYKVNLANGLASSSSLFCRSSGKSFTRSVSVLLDGISL